MVPWNCSADPQVWLSFLTLAVLEIVLGIDNIIFLAILVDRLPAGSARSARFLGLAFRDADAHRAAVLGHLARHPHGHAVHRARQ